MPVDLIMSCLDYELSTDELGEFTSWPVPIACTRRWVGRVLHQIFGNQV